MADITDVANAFVALIAANVYPNGTAGASIVPPTAPDPQTATQWLPVAEWSYLAPLGMPVMIYQGWPNSDQIDIDMPAGKVHVSVWPTPTERVTENFTPGWETNFVNAPTVTMTATGTTATVGGTSGPGQNVALMVNGLPYRYSVQTSDTATSIATALAMLINQVTPASNIGPVITIPGAHKLVARVGAQGQNIRTISRQEKVFQVSIWAPSPGVRDPLAGLLTSILSGTYRLVMPDGTAGIVRYKSSAQQDDLQKSGIWRRDLMYAVEFTTTALDTTYGVVVEKVAVSITDPAVDISKGQSVSIVTSYQ